MSLPRCSGVYWPADLDMLQRVFDRLCNERRLAKKDRKVKLRTGISWANEPMPIDRGSFILHGSQIDG
ncbi:hypothetical protein [Mesorhizobium sp.]|uniref:hypothetical protein n=1 Tax=Mesorhizobium sp. TaxID=1871066 RepID=UPI0025CF41C4|nr:hypothetical protein [Mesorhizobium sp.]